MKPKSQDGPFAHHAITSVNAVVGIDTMELFNGAVPDDSSSPIDQFITNTDSINRIFLTFLPRSVAPEAQDPDPNAGAEGPVHAGRETEVEAATIPGELGALAVLGYMSAVESYFRALLRQLIDVDDHVRSLAEPLEVTFAAARYHKPSLLAEALSEGSSFASEKNVTDMLKSRLGIKGATPIEVERVLREYRKLCEIRHCCVHRFGRLGSKNAVSLGIHEHKSMLEKPFSPTLDQLQAIADTLRIFVKTLNNHIFRTLIERVGTNQSGNGPAYTEWDWTGDYRRDRRRFKAYYDVFASQTDSPRSADLKTTYSGFKAYIKSRRTRPRGR